MFSNINEGGNVLGYLDILTGGSFSKATVFALSITPFINSSIIMQLLTVAINKLGEMQKEGEEGRKKIAQITRYVTTGIALIMAIGYYLVLRNENGAILHTTGFAGWLTAIVIILTFTAGSAIIVWLGERINEKGIGNGISIILFAGIISRAPTTIVGIWNHIVNGIKTIRGIDLGEGIKPVDGLSDIGLALVQIVGFFLVVAFVILMNNAERKIPVQYAKRVVGRKMYGGQSSHIPMKLAMSGVMPIIFASSFVSLPGTLKQLFTNPKNGEGIFEKILNIFNVNSWLYVTVFFILIIAFNYFYVYIQYNPIQIANDLRKNNGTVPGIRPGQATSDYIMKILNRITFIGAVFLGVIAILPILFTMFSKGQNILGGTSALIMVGVAIETVKQIESQMMMRHYKGFLE